VLAWSLDKMTLLAYFIFEISRDVALSTTTFLKVENYFRARIAQQLARES
jgi:hypothetical protein